MTIETINPLALKQGAKANNLKGAYGTSYGGSSPSNFNTMMGAVGAMEGVAATTAGMYGDVNSSTVLAAAFSGVNSFNAQTGGGAPYLASGGMNSLNASLMPGGSSAVVPGTENFSHMDMINTMNQNNLQLLELQATMQSNMQSWNTKSNILSADHKARMAMIEKFTARG
jgi:hypothetical protein